VQDNPTELAKAISDLASDPVKRATYAEAAYDRLVEDFGMDAGISKLVERLQNLCATR
jgi:hypothetical protein